MLNPAKWCVIGMLLAYALPARAQYTVDFPKDGNGLLDACSAVINVVDIPNYLSNSATSELSDKVRKLSWCKGYLQATTDMLEVNRTYLRIIVAAGVTLEGAEKAKSNAFDYLAGPCIPSSVGTLQLARVLVKWLRDHPERLHEPIVLITIEVFRGTFPCEQPKSDKVAKP